MGEQCKGRDCSKACVETGAGGRTGRGRHGGSGGRVVVVVEAAGVCADEGERRAERECVTMRRWLQCSSSRAWAWWSRSQGGPPLAGAKAKLSAWARAGRQRGAGGGACNQQSSRSPPARHMGNGAR